MPPQQSGEKTMSSRLLTMKFMQRAAAANAARESESNDPSHSDSPSTDNPQTPPPKRQRSSGSNTPTPTTPASSDLQAISAAVAAEEDKRREAISRQAAEAGESEWVLDFPAGAGASYPPPPSRPAVVAAGSLDDEDVGGGGRQTYGNYERKKKMNAWTDEGGGEDPVDTLINDAKAQAAKQRPPARRNLDHLNSISGFSSAPSPPSQGSKSQKKRKQRFRSGAFELR